MKMKYCNTNKISNDNRGYIVNKKKSGGKVLVISFSLMAIIFVGGLMYSHVNRPRISDYMNGNNSSYNMTSSNNKKNNNTSSNSSSSSSSYSTSSKLYKDSYDDTSIHMNSYEYNQFMNYLSSRKTNYAYSDLYDINKALDREKSQGSHNNNHDNQIEMVNGKFDSTKLVESIKKNNKTYRDSLPSGFKKSSLKDMKDSEIKAFADIIVDTLNYEIEKHPNIDIEELRCVLGNLKLYSSSSTSNAYVDDDDMMAVSPAMLKVVEVMNRNTGNDASRDVIVHEAMHLIQKGCKHNMEYDHYSQIGISKKWDDLEVNTLQWRWFYEGSAEKLMTTYTGDSPITYKYIVSYFDSLTTAGIANDNIKVDSLEEVSLSHNSNDFFKLMGADTARDKEELIKMMYTLDVLQFGRDDFYNKYEPIYGPKKTGDDLVLYQQELKVSICETMTKIFYSNLAEKMTKDNLSIDDTFYLIRLFEGDMNNHLEMNNTKKKEQSDVFAKDYMEIQNEFFNNLASSNNMSVDSLKDKFDNYEFGINKEKTLNSFSNDKKDYCFKKHQEVKNYAKTSISSYYSENVNNKSK